MVFGDVGGPARELAAPELPVVSAKQPLQPRLRPASDMVLCSQYSAIIAQAAASDARPSDLPTYTIVARCPSACFTSARLA
jgi:hypothetical protein